MSARADRKLPTVRESVEQFHQEIQDSADELLEFWDDMGDESDLLFFPEEPFESPDDFLDFYLDDEVQVRTIQLYPY